MYIDSFGTAVFFAAVAGAAALPFWSLVSGPFGGGATFGAYLLLASLLFSALSAPTAYRAARVGMVASLLCVGAAAVAASPWQVAIFAGLIVSMCRFVCLPLGPWWGRLIVEASLAGVAVLMVPLFIRDGTPVQVGMAVWGFFLVQGLYFLFDRWLIGLGPEHSVSGSSADLGPSSG